MSKKLNEMYNRASYFEMIQGVINRMGANSFQCKTWSMMLFSAMSVVLFQINDAEKAMYICFIVLFMLVIFWGLDAWYLQMEKQFRQLYNAVRKEPFPPDNDNNLYRMDFRQYPEKCILRIMFTGSVLPVYMPPVILISTILCKTIK